MKILSALFLVVIFLGACKNTPDRPDAILEDGYEPTEISSTPSSTTQTTPPANEPPQNAEGVWHYTCPNGCAGGGGGATPCTNCGTTLVHNTAYHNSGGANTNTSPVAAPAGNQQGSISNPLVNGISTPGANATNTVQPKITTNPKKPEPPQNDKGVWHYTCPNGCDGGGGAAAPCAKCGATLAHNQVYHQ